MAFNTGLLANPVSMSSHRLFGTTTRLSLRNGSSKNGGSVTLHLLRNTTAMRTTSLRLFAVLDDRNSEEDDEEKNVYETIQAMTERVKKAALVLQVEAVRAHKQLSNEEHVGYSEADLVKATLNGVQAPIRIEISDAALKLGAKRLSHLVHEAYKSAHENTKKSMMNKMSNISVDLGVQDEDEDEDEDEKFGLAI